MLKLYSNKISTEIRCKNITLNARISIKSFSLFIFSVTFFFPSLFFTQENIISGLENIHIYDNTTVIVAVIENLNTEHVSLDNNSKKTKIEKKTIHPEKRKKQNIALSKKKTYRKKIDKYSIKKNNQLIAEFTHNSKKEDYYSAHYFSHAFGINNLDQYKNLGNTILEEKILLPFIFIDQEKNNIQFYIDLSKGIELNLCTRPPPFS